MNMKIHFLGILLLIGILSGCNSSRNEEELSDFSALNGNVYLLTVDRVALQPKVSSPMDELKESDYLPTTVGNVYAVTFGVDGSQIRVEPGAIRGEKTTSADKTIRYYTLTSGVMAGGRFEVRSKAAGLEGELTIYGSGLPVISSERGSLLPGN